MTFAFSVKDRWQIAGQQQKRFERLTGQRISKRVFYKNDNPLTRNIKLYHVTYSLNYSGRKNNQEYEFFFPQDTISIYAYDNIDNDSFFKAMVNNNISGIFKGQSANWVSGHLDMDITQTRIRGIEEEGIKYSEIPKSFYESDKHFQVVDKNKTLEVNKRTRYGTQKNQYMLNLWM